MNTLEIYEAINATKSVRELKETIIKVWGEDGRIMGRTEPFLVKEMLLYIDWFAEDYPAVVLAKTKGRYDSFRGLPTRQYGIRQQLCMILLNPTR